MSYETTKPYMGLINIARARHTGTFIGTKKVALAATVIAIEKQMDGWREERDLKLELSAMSCEAHLAALYAGEEERLAALREKLALAREAFRK